MDGFGGRGRSEVAVITNSAVPRTSRIALGGVMAPSVEVFQATAATRKRQLDSIKLQKGEVTLTVPADSVTTAVATTASTEPLVYLVVKIAG